MFQAAISVKEDARVAALHRYAILDTAPEQAFDDVTELARQLCQVPMATVTFVDRDRQWFKSENGVGLTGSSRADSLCTFAIEQDDLLIIEDTLTDTRSCNSPFVTLAPNLRFYAGAQLRTRDGHNIGTVCVFDTVPRKLEVWQKDALRALARQTMANIELRFRVAETERQAEALRTTEKLAVVGRLASSMAHEINNPLQSVTNLLFMAQQTAEGSVRQSIEQAQEELIRVTHIVTHTLRFHSQAENAMPARLGEIVESIVVLFATRLRHAATQLVVVDTQTALLDCYAADLRQVLANFFANALDAVLTLEPREVRVRIHDATHPLTGAPGVRLTMADSGCGMSLDVRTRLFEPFYSTKGARGTGLGLWVSLGILKKHEATLSIRSATQGPRRGTTFSIFFPHRSVPT